jgi:citrate lyase beta subunit
MLRTRRTGTWRGTGDRRCTPACWVSTETDHEIAEARESIATYRSSEAEGVGAIGRDGKLVDAAHMRLATNVLYKASLADGSSTVR